LLLLGLREAQVRKAVDAAVTALLGALISLVSKPQGAAKLYDFVAKQEPGALSDLANVIGEAGQKAYWMIAPRYGSITAPLSEQTT
jgi:hypothetical protein